VFLSLEYSNAKLTMTCQYSSLPNVNTANIQWLELVEYNVFQHSEM